MNETLEGYAALSGFHSNITYSKEGNGIVERRKNEVNHIRNILSDHECVKQWIKCSA